MISLWLLAKGNVGFRICSWFEVDARLIAPIKFMFYAVF